MAAPEGLPSTGNAGAPTTTTTTTSGVVTAGGGRTYSSDSPRGPGGGGGGDRRRGGRRNERERNDGAQKVAQRGETTEKVVFINRCAKVVKGGRRFSFSALIVAGDHDGRVGFGFGKANEVSEAIRKASDSARKSMVKVAIQENTIPHEVFGEFDGGKVLLRPATPGTGIIAGGGVRAVVEAAGIKDVLGKSLGSSNHANVVKATLDALSQLRRREDVFKVRGIKMKNRDADQNGGAEAAATVTPEAAVV
jgi:small subunit ribosomal protein S5